MAVAVNNKGTQDWVAIYNGQGTTVGSNVVESGVAMMAAMVEDGGSRQQRRVDANTSFHRSAAGQTHWDPR
jgi:hypothetical protein